MDLAGDVIEAAVDVVVEMAESAFEIASAAVDAAEQLMEDAINACVDLAEVAYDACAAVKEAWDNMDAGLKQWIVMGVSIAVSFIPVVGPLISCIIDGTFVDMLTAISSGDWAMVGMCAIGFLPGVGGVSRIAKALKKVDNLIPMKNTASHLSHAKDLGLKNVAALDKYAKKELKRVIKSGGAGAKFGRLDRGLEVMVPMKNQNEKYIRVIVHPEAAGGRGALGTCYMTSQTTTIGEGIGFPAFLEAFT